MNTYTPPRPDESTARNPLLLIDDDVENLKLLERILDWAGFMNVRSCTSGREGLALLGRFDPYLVILDLKMPGINGYDFLERVRQGASDHSFLPILVYTADLTPEAKIKALELGATDFLTKPGDAVEIQFKIRNYLKTRKMHSDLQNHNQILEAKVRQRTEELNVARREAVELLATISEYRDDDTGEHVRRVGLLSASIARHIGRCDPEFLESLLLAAPLHDIGKIAIPDSILHKPGPLSEEEIKLMQRHVPIGGTILAQKLSPLLLMARDIVLFHHERWDGRGYPFGLAGEKIPLSARIVSVADAFDAMTNDRPYRKKRPQIEALVEISNLAGSQFDPLVVAALHRYLMSPTRTSFKAA